MYALLGGWPPHEQAPGMERAAKAAGFELAIILYVHDVPLHVWACRACSGTYERTGHHAGCREATRRPPARRAR